MNQQVLVSASIHRPTLSSEKNEWSINGRQLSRQVVDKITSFLVKFNLWPNQGAKVIESIYLHPNQLSLKLFLDYCLSGAIGFVFLGDRAGVGSKERARDVFSFESLEEMITYSRKSERPRLKVEVVDKFSDKEMQSILNSHNQSVCSSLFPKEQNYRYNIRGKNGRFVKQSPIESGNRIHENWAKVFNAHTPPPIPTNYNYYKNLKLGSPEYNGSR